MRSFRHKTLTIAAASLIVAVGTGTAYAYWSAGGAGVGAATTGTSTALTVNDTTSLTAMFPGDTAQTLSGDFDNTSSGPIHVATVTVSISGVTKAVGAQGVCTADDYTLAGATMTINADVPTGTGQGAWTGATIQFNNTTANQDGCQGATVDLAYTVA